MIPRLFPNYSWAPRGPQLSPNKKLQRTKTNYQELLYNFTLMKMTRFGLMNFALPPMYKMRLLLTVALLGEVKYSVNIANIFSFFT